MNNAKIPLASTVENCVDELSICDMWKTHYESLLNSVQSCDLKAEISSKTDKDTECTRKFSIASITNSFKHLKGGKASGVDGLAAEHFLYADRHIYVYLSLLFNSFMYHGYLPAEFMKTAIVPIIKCKTGNSSDKNNYRPIALVTACSKIFELCLLEIIEVYLDTYDHQFGFKKQHSTDMCIFTLKSVIKYYTQQSTPVYSCFLDASKAFDRVNHRKLFNKLIVRKVPLLIVRMFIFWYSKQEMCIKWGQSTSSFFTVSNGVRQGGILSPRLFAVYVDDLSKHLHDARSGCFIGHQCINHVMYADDICLLAPSALGLQKLLEVCYGFSQDNDIIFNSLKSVYVVFRPKRYKLFCPPVYLHREKLSRIHETKYLGCFLSDDQSDDVEIYKQIRTLYTRSNKLLRMFSYCTIDVKKELFRSYCSSLYCCALWSDYRKATYRKLTVAFNNIHRRLLGLPWRCSASAMYANHDLPNLDTVIRRSLYGFIQRLSVSQNSIVRTIEQSWLVRIKLWDVWAKVLYL